MHTVKIDIADDKLDTFLNIIKSLKSDIVKSIKIENNLEIESIKKDSLEYKEIEKIKKENNKKYSLDEVKKELGI